MDLNELRKMNINALNEMINAKEKEISDLKMQISHKHSGNVRALRKAKKGLAQLLTLINEKTNNG